MMMIATVENREIFIPHKYLASPKGPVGISRTCLILVKLEWLGYRAVKKYYDSMLSRFRTKPDRDGQTDGKNCYINIAKKLNLATEWMTFVFDTTVWSSQISYKNYERHKMILINDDSRLITFSASKYSMSCLSRWSPGTKHRSQYSRFTELWTQSTSVEKKLCDDFFNSAFVIHLSLLRLSSTLDKDCHEWTYYRRHDR